jgi:hypothetical protein
MLSAQSIADVDLPQFTKRRKTSLSLPPLRPMQPLPHPPHLRPLRPQHRPLLLLILQIPPGSKRMFYAVKVLIIIRHALRRDDLVRIRLQLRRECRVDFWRADLYGDADMVHLIFGEPGRMGSGDACLASARTFRSTPGGFNVQSTSPFSSRLPSLNELHPP